jgi:hypothetical protein
MISSGKVSGPSGGSFAALQKRLAQGKGKMSPISAQSRANKTSWAKGKAKSAGNPNATLAVSGATPGVKPPGKGQ